MSISDRIRRALAIDPDGDEYDAIVRDLHTDAEHRDAIFDELRALCASTHPRDKRLAAEVLGQLGAPTFPLRGRAVALLTDLLDDADPSVLQASAIALGHQRDARAIGPLLRQRAHADADVRHGVVFGLLTHDDPRAIAALIELSGDPDEDVRDWATFGLGSQTDVDSPALRDALLARIHDPNRDVRAEALVGLARRKDARVTAALIAELGSEEVGTLSLEAAMELGDPRLVPALKALRDGWPDEREAIEAAIAACTRS